MKCKPEEWCYCSPSCRTPKPLQPTEYVEPRELTYREHQVKLREAGWDVYNSDYVDEFGHW